MGFLSTLSPWLMAGANRSPMERIPGVTPYAPDSEWGGPMSGPMAGPLPAHAAPTAPPNAQTPQASPFVAPPGFMTPQPKQPEQGGVGGWLSRVNERIGFQPQDWMRLGFSLMGNAQGSNWAGVGQDLGEIGRERMLRQRFENDQRRQKIQDTREQSLFDRQQTEWGRADQLYRNWESAVQNESDPQRRAMLQAMGPQGYGQAMLRQEERDFEAEQRALDRRATASAQSNVLGRYFQSRDAERLADENEVASRLQTVGMPALTNIRATIEAAGERMLPGQPISARDRVTLGRLFNGSSEDRATLEVWRAQVLTPALEVMRGLGAMSQREFEEALNAFANPDMTYGAAMRLVNQRMQEAQRRIAMSSITTEFFQGAGGITGRSWNGEDYGTYAGRRLQEMGLMPSGSWSADDPGRPGGGVEPGSVQPPREAVEELRRDTSAQARREWDETARRNGWPTAAEILSPQRAPQVRSREDLLNTPLTEFVRTPTGPRPPRAPRPGYRWERRRSGAVGGAEMWFEVPDREARR